MIFGLLGAGIWLIAQRLPAEATLQPLQHWIRAFGMSMVSSATLPTIPAGDEGKKIHRSRA
jgi:hypothetical protein